MESPSADQQPENQNGQQPPQRPEPPKPKNVKTYNLTPQETQLLRMLNEQQRNILSITLSFIAGSRLAYRVTPTSHFELNAELTEIKIGELEVPPHAGVPSTKPTQPQPPAGPAAKTSQGGQAPTPPAPQQ